MIRSGEAEGRLHQSDGVAVIRISDGKIRNRQTVRSKSGRDLSLDNAVIGDIDRIAFGIPVGLDPVYGIRGEKSIQTLAVSRPGGECCLLNRSGAGFRIDRRTIAVPAV